MAGLIVTVLMIGTVVILGLTDNYYFSKFQQTSSRNEVKNRQQEIVTPHNESSKIEAIKRQIEKNSSPNTGAQSTLGQSNMPENNRNNLVESAPQSESNLGIEHKTIKINIEPNEIKSQAASEIIDVPKGVVVKVRRIRIVEHSVNIEWSEAITGKGEVGIKQLVSASIQGEIQRAKGYILQQTESMEYEITLDGEKHPQYQLIWMDVWLKGFAEINEGINSYQQPFQFRDRAELRVVPLSA